MALFVIGALGIIAVCLAGLFLPCYYSQGWGYASFGSVRAYETGRVQTYRLVDNFTGAWYDYLLWSVIVFGLALYIVLMLCKKSNLIPNALIFILAIAPFCLMLYETGSLQKDGEYIKNKMGLIMGAGVKSGLTDIGNLLIVLDLVFFVVLIVGFTLNHRKLLRKAEEGPVQQPKEIEAKKHSDKNISEHEFKL